MIHHVTEVESGTEDRLSLIISLQSANAYHPDRTVYDTMARLDINAPEDVAPYLFWRQKTWHCKEILEEYALNQKFTDDGDFLAAKLRAVSEELNRVADLLDGAESDRIGFFNEKKENMWLQISNVFLHRLEQQQAAQQANAEAEFEKKVAAEIKDDMTG